MISNLETELKILLEKNEFDCLAQNYDLTFITQTNTYFDTIDFQLRNKGCAMRIREKQGNYLFTLKTPDRKGHLEHECILNGNTIEDLKNENILKLLNELNIFDDLIVIGQCVTHRGVVQLDKAELCFDINEYNNQVDYEIEYEYKCDHNGIEVFNDILKPIHKTYTHNCKSKIARACQV